MAFAGCVAPKSDRPSERPKHRSWPLPANFVQWSSTALAPWFTGQFTVIQIGSANAFSASTFANVMAAALGTLATDIKVIGYSDIVEQVLYKYCDCPCIFILNLKRVIF